MKTLTLNSSVKALLTATLLALQFVGNTQAEVPVTTGVVTNVSRENGTLTVISEQTQRPITYFGMEKAVVQFGSGKVATIADVQVRQPVTVVYAIRDQKPYVAKIMIPDPKPVASESAASTLTAAERRALESRSARDGDITTKPGTKARLDDDITTQPGRKDPRDTDITKKTDK